MILTVTLNASIDKYYRIDSLHPYEVNRVQEVNNTAGGKGLNVARVAAQSGEEAYAAGFIGGHTGALLESLLEGEGVVKAFTKISGETRCCVNVFDAVKKKNTEFLEPGSRVTQEDMDRFLAEYRQLLEKADIVAIAGSMPRGMPTDFYGRMVTLSKEAKKPVILDTSGPALIAALPACPTWIKPNADEIRQITGREVGSLEQVVSAAKHLHEDGIANVAVSLGKDGVVVVCESGVYHGITPDIEVVNTVGCGDSMVAGFAVGTVRGYSIEDTISYAVAVSTANALNIETGGYHEEDLKRILPLVKTIRIG